MKKIVAMGLAAAMVLSCVPAYAAEETTTEGTGEYTTM